MRWFKYETVWCICGQTQIHVKTHNEVPRVSGACFDCRSNSNRPIRLASLAWDAWKCGDAQNCCLLHICTIRTSRHQIRLFISSTIGPTSRQLPRSRLSALRVRRNARVTILSKGTHANHRDESCTEVKSLVCGGKWLYHDGDWIRIKLSTSVDWRVQFWFLCLSLSLDSLIQPISMFDLRKTVSEIIYSNKIILNYLFLLI